MARLGRGLRGSALENLINVTNNIYRNNGLALVQKIPTPITPVQMDSKHHITLAYFDQKSTVDYIGAVQGYPVCFDAKECKTDTFPLSNIHEHQVKFMKDFEKQGGLSFFLLDYTEKGEYYFLSYKELERFWKRMEDGGRKSFRHEELQKDRFFKRGEKDPPVPYLRPLECYIKEDDLS